MHSLFSLRFVRSVLLGATLVISFGCAMVVPQETKRVPATKPAPSPVEVGEAITRKTSEPYTGDLSIFENAAREKNLQINRVMDILGIKEGSGVADIGAGSGWFTVRAAQRVGAGGTVYAVEINPGFVKHIEERAAKEKFTNIRAVLGKEDDPLLPAESVDAVLILKTYHEIAQPIRVLTRLRAALRPGARLGIIDRNGSGDDHGLNRESVIKEAGRAGFSLVEEHDFVKPDGMDYFLVFRAR
ncbi:MAG TPA: class I SAM-dependent methyltransferase [Pyrinomonadaceae bacterium]|jgi:predicted methyltransferase|nr:class I SAM-dependent methyltransferase [Pyrinomonadaceae bacterium]